MPQLLVINPQNVTDEEVAVYPVREAARAIVLDADSNVALLHVTNKNYYKLPGGGLEAGEDRIIALNRECIEEIGCHVEVVREIGSIVEYRRMFEMKQISYCYLARVVGTKGSPNYTDSEIAAGFEQIWVSFNDAERLLRECDATDIEGKDYIVVRDTAFLAATKNLL